MNFTPGPWRIATSGNMSNRIEACSGKMAYDNDDGFRTVAMFQHCCADSTYAGEEANALANARLIAAAPDLLAALQGIWGEPATTSNGCYTNDPAEIASRAAIAKATQP